MNIFLCLLPHIIDVVLNVSGICRRPSGVDGRGQVVRGIPPQGLLAARNSSPGVVRAWGGRGIMGVPEQVNVKSVLERERQKQAL